MTQVPSQQSAAIPALATLALILIVAAFVAGLRIGHPYTPRGCTFDGGGTLVSGDAGRTSDGHIWACVDSRLYRIR